MENVKELKTGDELIDELREMYGEDSISSKKDTVNKLVYVPIDKLYPHPDNPRKELGDLYELTESIKARGIMQNLTVVSHEDGYRIIIGHRRAAAAREAGLKNLPCAIVEMTPEEQIATMLVENIQRSDLTAYEQAQSFQLMMDMGETVTTLADKTGFSPSTIRRRIKLNELNPEMLKEASGKQITMDDLDRLGRIKDVNTRNIVLGFAGTVNFENEYKKAIEKQRQKECAAVWRTNLLARGLTELTMPEANSGKYTFEGYIDLYGKLSQIDEKLREGVRFYYAICGTAIYLRGEKTAADEDTPEALATKLKEQEHRKRKQLLADAAARAYESRVDFIKGYTTALSKAHIKDAVEIIVKKEWDYMCSGFDRKIFTEAITGESPAKDKVKFNDISFDVSKHPEYALICYAYCMLGDMPSRTYFAYDNTWINNIHLNAIYSFLEKLGYIMNDEEREMRFGTSDLFAQTNAENDEDEEDCAEGDSET